MKRTILLAMTALAGLARADQWEVLTDQRDIHDVAIVNQKVWCASGGGLAVFDPATEEFGGFTTVDGLAGVEISRMAADSAGGLWMAFQNRAVQYFKPGVGPRYTITSLKDDSRINRINDILVAPRGVYLATDIGVALLTYVPNADRWVWLERYTQLGTFPAEQEARCVLIVGNDIWVGTGIGVARGDITSPLPLTWQNYTAANGLAGESIRSMAYYHGEIYAATNGGLCKWTGTNWRLENNVTSVVRLLVADDSLRGMAYRDTIRSALTWTGGNWRTDFSGADWPTTIAVDQEGTLWIGLRCDNLSRGGLARFQNGNIIHNLPDGPVTNRARDLSFSADGQIYLVGGAGGDQYGLSQWDGTKWRNAVYSSLRQRMLTYENRYIALDSYGGAWVGTLGGGLGHYTADGELTVYDATNLTGARLMGVGVTEDAKIYCVASGLAFDTGGNLWLVNRATTDGRVLVCIPNDFIRDPQPDKPWVYFDQALFNNYDFFELVVMDGMGRKWLASEDPSTGQTEQGVYVFDENGTLDDPNDDRVWGPLGGLNSPQVLSMAYDNAAGYMWVGSIDGAYYINATNPNPEAERFTQLYDLRQQAVNSISVDRADNKWFATNDGVLVLDPDLYTVRRRITVNSPDMLPTTPVITVRINPYTGWAYLGTNSGTAALLTPYRDFGDKIAGLTFEPNPFNPELGRLFFTGTSLAGDAAVRILTPDGRLVRHLSHDEAALGWDGRNESERLVADGVYLILASNSAGDAAQGKVAVIRK